MEQALRGAYGELMATFTVDFFCSLDGSGSARGWPGYWGKEGPELRENRVRTFAQDQVLVFGATIDRLKRETQTPMRSHGTISLNRSLLAAHLHDGIPDGVGAQRRDG
jgi:hypothetical protein